MRLSQSEKVIAALKTERDALDLAIRKLEAQIAAKPKPKAKGKKPADLDPQTQMALSARQ